MKCLLIGVVLCLASLSDQSALKCVTGTKGVPCPEITEQRIETATEEENLPDGKNCAIGTHWKNRCNDCSCSDGNPACTDKACPGQENELDSKCAPGSVWRDDCNTCWCVDGTAQCTRLGCTSMIITDFNPDRNDEDNNKKDTNKDNKTTEQKIFFPSRVGGTENETRVIVCPAKRMFVKDCNTCWCNEEGTSYVCTRKVCVDNFEDVVDSEKQQPAKLKCKPDEVFQLDCNSCRCNSDGTAYSCTRRACPLIPVKDTPEKETHKSHHSRKARATQQETTKNCQPGQEFRMDCNKCLCDDEGQNYSCTRNDCTTTNNNNGGTKTKREISRPMKAECMPGSTFRQRCNTCHCTADGAHATCTVYKCKDDVEIIEPDSKGSFRCNPGEQFKRGCNDCTCSADGKDVFCTLRLCEQDITNI